MPMARSCRQLGHIMEKNLIRNLIDCLKLLYMNILQRLILQDIAATLDPIVSLVNCSIEHARPWYVRNRIHSWQCPVVTDFVPPTPESCVS